MTAVLDRIDQVLDEYITWHGSDDAMAAWFGKRDFGTPDGLRIGPRQAQLLAFVLDRPGCSLNQASIGGGYGITGRLRGAYALARRGLLEIDNTTDRRQYHCYITAAGERALGAY